MRSTRLWKSLRRASAAALAAATLGAAGPALAQQPSLALDRFDPAPAGDRMFGVQSPYAAGELTPHVMLLGDYAHNPLVIRTDPGNNRVGAVVSNQLFLHLNGGLSLANRVYVNVDVPVALAQSGDSPPDGSGQTFTSPAKVQFGDLRLGVRVRLFGEYHDPFQLAVSGYLWVPTGAKGAFVSTGTARGLPQLVLGGRVAERLVWSAAAGPEIQGAQQFGSVGQGAMLKWGAGLGVLLLDNRHLQLGPEVSGAVTFRDLQKRTTNLEVLLDAKYRVIDDLEVGVGAGPGLTSGIGTPDVRAVFMVAYTPEQRRDRDHDGILDRDDACPDVPGVADADPGKNGCPPPSDRDHDGIPDKDDACPDVPGVPNPAPSLNGCPPDRDGDGITDAEDACPDEAGPKNADPKLNGCPPRDRDGDGILDRDDACPDVKGVHTSDPKTNGCPLPVDSDGDGILDDKDACPNEKGPPDPDPTKNGCPRSVRVTETEIFILEQVQFDTGKATIKKVSDKLLDEVAGVLKEHPEIKRIEVQGHTDSRGAAAQNKTLSQARADAVMKALIKRGIVKGRLTARGYGQEKPIADNGTDAGRQQNRRVQFTIVEKQPKGTH
jgi:outer membrane protein OmpA-like peptidoglycan-associated protein